MRDAAGDEARVLLVQPKRLALFAYLVLKGPDRLTRRDSLLALFWPESADDAARHSLRQAVHGIRQALGSDVIARRGNDAIGVGAGQVWCDAAEFERAVSERRYEDALGLYGGALLDGFHVAGVAPELERWVDGERARLHGMALGCAHALTDDAERVGNLPLALHSARDTVRLAPLDERAFRRLMMLLHATGDRAGALRAYESFAARMAAELEAEPSAETQALADRVRREVAVGGATAVRSEEPARVGSVPPVTSGDVILGEGGGAPPGPRYRSRSRRAAAVAATALVAVGALVAAGAALVTRAHARTPAVLAVGTLRIQARDTSLSPRLVRELLSTDLARLQGIGVVSAERVDELTARDARGDTVRVSDVARRAGATDVVEGILSGGSGHPLRLDVRLVDPAGGIIRGARVLAAADVFALADSTTGWVAALVGQTAPQRPLAEVTSTSLVARRFYDEGLRALNQGDTPAALRLFRAALADDSTFAMAAYYAGVTAQGLVGDAVALPLMAQALRLSRRGPERERLFAATTWAAATNDPRAVATAESLATRYPLEPDGELWLGQALVWAGDRGRAIPHLRNVMARDASTLDAAPNDTARQRLPCRACAALGTLVGAYVEGDSLDLAEREARDWTRRQPANAEAWRTLSDVYELEDRIADALAARREASRRAGRDLADATYRARLAIRTGDFATADRLLTDRAADGELAARVEALWWLAISLRHQGRAAAALGAADRVVALDDSARRSGGHAVDGASPARLLRAAILLQLGRARDAASAFEAVAAAPLGFPADPPLALPGVIARRRAWGLALAATAYAAAGDTTPFGGLADRVAAAGRASAFGRDRRLASYVRGLSYAARHDYTAAEGALRAAIHSPNNGFTRVNLELARVLVAEHRARDAVPVLRAALRGGMEGSNLYVTRTELQDALARAYAAAGEADSARVYRARVDAALGRARPGHS
ncbi:transcriptional activator domain-containing protein [Gemmatirosa kalamazoonensis]|uniref:Transcriptional activator domain-containing protein n=1 Tax=Gemmatirosa kalamazoonensis TaxID=861299 RepID=W0RDN7_9BACT|nr:transcriptional activator domain-containing protein [Gemmatirosa kalamazoonensis]